MTKEELRELLENELFWRTEELNFFKKQILNLNEEDDKDKYRKSLVLILYSHLEGFLKVALTSYAQYLSALGKKREVFDVRLVATSMDSEFKAYDNKDIKSPLFTNKKIPDEKKIHGLYRRVNLLDSATNMMNQPLYINDAAIDTESNVWYIVLQKNLYRLGLPVDMFEEYSKDIDGLVNRRNSIAHGSQSDGVSEKEYLRWENSIKDVMESIVKKIYLYVNNEKYVKTSE